MIWTVEDIIHYITQEMDEQAGCSLTDGATGTSRARLELVDFF